MKLLQKIILASVCLSCEAKRPHSFLIPNTITADKTCLSEDERSGRGVTSKELNDVHSVGSSIIHGAEVVEKAFVDAIREEVDVLFHDPYLDHARTLEKAKVKIDSKVPLHTHHRKVVHVERRHALDNPDLEYFTLNHFPYGWGIH